MLLILRVFYSMNRDVFYLLTQFLIAVNEIFYITFFFIPIFLCFPRSKIWFPEEVGHCLDVNDLYLASAIFNVLSDNSDAECTYVFDLEFADVDTA